MFSWLAKNFAACFTPLRRRYGLTNRNDDNERGDDDVLLWSRDLDRHCFGKFSFSVVQANSVIEDYSQVEVGRNATYVGVYDGHGGPEAAGFVRDHLFDHLMRHAQQNGTISEAVIRAAFSATEEAFLTHVRRSRDFIPSIASAGSCCLVGVIWKGTLYLANAGDSRAIIGSLDSSNKIETEQLTRDDNVNSEEVRQELWALHPGDDSIVVLKEGVWRVKGVIQVSKSIGDLYLKSAEFNLDALFPRFKLNEPLRQPALTAEPSIYTRAIQAQDKFVIFASDGLWEQLTNQEAAEIVHKYPQAGIARRLVIKALNIAARKRGMMKYADLKNVEPGTRRHFHDDITVVVIFLDQEVAVSEMSVKGFKDAVGKSKFSVLEGMVDVTQS